MNMYGTLAMQYDKQAVTPLHFTTRLDEMQKTIDDKVNGQSDELEKAIAQTKELAVASDKKVDEVNASYKKAYEAGEMKEAQKILTDHKALNDQLLATFKQAQDDLVRLTWEDEVIFPHEHAQNNITNLTNAITVLKAGKVTKALEDSLYLVDNNWYAYDFEKEVYDYFTNYVTDQPADRLMWGAGRIVGHEDLYDVIHSLQSKKDGDDVKKEIASLEKALETQKALLKKTNNEEIQSLEKLQQLLETK